MKLQRVTLMKIKLPPRSLCTVPGRVSAGVNSLAFMF